MFFKKIIERLAQMLAQKVCEEIYNTIDDLISTKNSQKENLDSEKINADEKVKNDEKNKAKINAQYQTSPLYDVLHSSSYRLSPARLDERREPK